MTPDTYLVDERQHIWVGGVSITSLVETYGTPLFVLDLTTVRHRIDQYRAALAELEPAGKIYYAGKAFLTMAMAGYLQTAGVGLDVVSGGELYTALQGGFNPGEIVFHGNLKTPEEMAMGLRERVGYFVVDSLDELAQLSQTAAAMGVTAQIMLRITPGIEAHTHAFIRTGQFDSKFGFALADGLADEAVIRALKAPHIRLAGFHAHIGSQILEEEPFLANAGILLDYAVRWYRETGWWPEVLDVGGGVGVRYSLEDEPPSLGRLGAGLAHLLAERTPSGAKAPQLLMEPGRSIVAEAGITVYTVGAVKTVPGGKRYIAVDGGMGDNIRPALYQAEYQAVVDGKVAWPVEPEATALAGRYCESGDILVREARLPSVSPGDHVVVFGTGAYNYAMASTYNRVPRPAVVAVAGGQTALWVARETFDDLVRLDQPYRPF